MSVNANDYVKPTWINIQPFFERSIPEPYEYTNQPMKNENTLIYDTK
jgi:hypothetical protein